MVDDSPVLTVVAASVVVGDELGMVDGDPPVLHAALTRATTMTLAMRDRTSVRFDDACRSGRGIGFTGHSAPFGLIHAGQQVDTDHKEHDQSKYGRSG